jgi:tRNA(fMet)-specific endonuclease VapC
VKYVLDTNTVSALMGANPAVIVRLRSLPKDSVGVPEPAYAEIEYGIARLPRSRRKDGLSERLAAVRTEIAGVAWTREVSERFGALKALLESRGERLDDMDLAIAAHALASGAVLVTADESHMGRIPGLPIESWAPTKRQPA